MNNLRNTSGSALSKEATEQTLSDAKKWLDLSHLLTGIAEFTCTGSLEQDMLALLRIVDFEYADTSIDQYGEDPVQEGLDYYKKNQRLLTKTNVGTLEAGSLAWIEDAVPAINRAFKQVFLKHGLPLPDVRDLSQHHN